MRSHFEAFAFSPFSVYETCRLSDRSLRTAFTSCLSRASQRHHNSFGLHVRQARLRISRRYFPSTFCPFTHIRTRKFHVRATGRTCSRWSKRVRVRPFRERKYHAKEFATVGRSNSAIAMGTESLGVREHETSLLASPPRGKSQREEVYRSVSEKLIMMPPTRSCRVRSGKIKIR